MRHRTVLSILGLGTLSMLALGSLGYGADKQAKASTPDASSQKVIAEVGRGKVTLQQFQEVLDTAPANARQAVLKQKEKLLEEVVNQELLFQEAEALKLAQDPAVQDALEKAKRQFLIQRFLQIHLQDKVKVTPEDVQAYYDKNKATFVAPEKVRAAHILVKDEKLAKDLLNKIRKGADFSSLAMENSIDPSKVNGGDLGFFTKGKMIPEFEKAAFALKKDEVSDVVQTQFGYHIIKSLEKVPSRPMEFSEIKDRLAHQLSVQKQQQEVNSLIAGLRQKTTVKTHPELLDEVK